MQHGNRALPVLALLFVILGSILAAAGYGTAAWSTYSLKGSVYGYTLAKLEVQLGPIMTCEKISAMDYSDGNSCDT